MGIDPRKRQNAGIELLEIANLYKQYRPELTDKAAFKLAMLGNPELGEVYSGRSIRRDGLPEVKKFLVGNGPFPEQLRAY